MLSLRPKTNYNRNMIIEGETNNFTTLQLKTFYDKLLELQISESYFLEEYCNNNYHAGLYKYKHSDTQYN